jgi:hypothetical protein
MANEKDAKGGKTEPAGADTPNDNRKGLNVPDADGAALEALAVAKGRARAAGVDENPDFRVDEEHSLEAGYIGYSPTGPGENDHPAIQSGRLGSLGEFDVPGDGK